MKILGINAVFHDPAAALVVDGQVFSAAEEERFSRRKHGKPNVPFAAWETPDLSAAWCLSAAGLTPADVDVVGYSFDPALSRPMHELGLDDPFDHLRVDYARRAPSFLATALPGLDPDVVRFVPHHVAHAASAGLAGPHRDCDVLVLDGRGESASHLAGRYRDGRLDVMVQQSLPHSLGLVYEDLTAHLGFQRSSDEYKVMALASYGEDRFRDEVAQRVYATDTGGFRTEPLDLPRLAKPLRPGEEWSQPHADLAASIQHRLEEVLLELARSLRRATGGRHLVLAGGVALNCVANTRLFAESGYSDIWVQPAAGDAGTALGAALHLAQQLGEPVQPMAGAAIGRGFDDDEIERALVTARIPYLRPPDMAVTVADALAANQLVAWFQGRSEYGPRALGHRSLLAHPGHAANLERINDVKGREQFRPVAPMVLEERAGDIFSRGPIPSPYMLFVHDVAPHWRERIAAVVHVDGTARIQTVSDRDEPEMAAVLHHFERRTGLPVIVNTSLNTAGRPMVDSPRDVLECFGSAPIDVLAIGPFVVQRTEGRP